MTDDIVAQLRLYTERLRAERDEARQRVCEDAIRNGRVYRRVGSDTVRCETSKEVAKMMGWDCFKEAEDDPYIVAQLRLYTERLRAERDEARQRVCEMHIHYSNAYRKVGSQIVQCETVQEVATAYRWDCYGEHDDLPN